MDETIQKSLIQDFVAELEQKVVNNTIVPEDFKTALYQLKEAKFKVQSLLELLQANDGKMNKLYRQVANENYADLIDDLNSMGYRYRKQNKNLRDAFEKMGYRIMEQTRSGRREDVFYSFLRIFISLNTPFDRKLLSAFKQSSDEMFKVLIFSFLSGIIEDKTNTEE
jgi:hypothetical protein